ncbi:hypothetical protein QQZ08_004178 [Neonectria magnoliae]|uniref:Uncharacterized protein n=1 Tax=Neonectria magnoliae TaxID=2732573 RepID=A0ABR1I8P1_9HYPO
MASASSSVSTSLPKFPPSASDDQDDPGLTIRLLAIGFITKPSSVPVPVLPSTYRKPLGRFSIPTLYRDDYHLKQPTKQELI